LAFEGELGLLAFFYSFWWKLGDWAYEDQYDGWMGRMDGMMRRLVFGKRRFDAFFYFFCGHLASFLGGFEEVVWARVVILCSGGVGMEFLLRLKCTFLIRGVVYLSSSVLFRLSSPALLAFRFVSVLCRS